MRARGPAPKAAAVSPLLGCAWGLTQTALPALADMALASCKRPLPELAAPSARRLTETLVVTSTNSIVATTPLSKQLHMSPSRWRDRDGALLASSGRSLRELAAANHALAAAHEEAARGAVCQPGEQLCASLDEVDGARRELMESASGCHVSSGSAAAQALGPEVSSTASSSDSCPSPVLWV